MSDLIDREAVLDSLKEHRALYCDNTPETFSKLSYAEKSRVDELDTAIATIINLPSVENKGDLISRQDAIDAVGSMLRRKFGIGGNLAEITLTRLPSAEKKGEWIPVSEKLPEERQSVLVWCPQFKNIYCAYLDKEQWWIFGAFVQIVPSEVVAWMPLTEPYQKGGE